MTTDRLWYYDDDFDEPMAPALADECARFDGRGEVGIHFAQCLAAFLAAAQPRAVLLSALTGGPDW